MGDEQLIRPPINAFCSKHHPYYIFSLHYSQKSAGLCAYYYLCHILNELGYEAYVIADEPVPKLRTPILTYEIRQKHIAEGRHPIAVYGETTQGNPLLGDVVVRWILNSVGRIGAEITFGDNDLLFYWDKMFCLYDNPKILTVPVFDTDLFNKMGVDESERSGYCFYANKYFYFDHGVISNAIRCNGMNLTKENELSHSEIADILRRKKVLFTYEESAICGEAALCGCLPILVLNDYNKHLRESTALPKVYENEIDFSLPYINDKLLSKLMEFNFKCYGQINKTQLNEFITITQQAADRAVNENHNDDFVDFCKRNNNQIYLYGTGMLSHQCHRTLSIIGVEVLGFIVTDDVENILNKYRGLPVYRLSEVAFCLNNIAIVLGMTIQHKEEVILLLKKRGFYNYISYPLFIK